MSGWIKLHRSVLQNPWMRNATMVGIWVYILMNVAYQPEDVIFEGKRITLQPGQGVFKFNEIAKSMGVPKSTLYRVIELFQNEKQIEKQSTPRNTLVTVVNWEKYQMIGKQDETQMGNKWETNGKQTGNLPIIKELKNKELKNKEKINKKEKTDDFEDFWKVYPKKKGKGAARKAFENALKKEGVTGDVLIDAVIRQRCGSQWTKDNGQYIPYPATWLNQERWEDEPDFTSADGLQAQQKPKYDPNARNDVQAGYQGAMEILEGLIDE